MNRRSFLSALLAIPVVGPAIKPLAKYVIGVDLGLPGSDATVVSVLDEINRVTLQYFVPRMTDIIFQESPLTFRLNRSHLPWKGRFYKEDGQWKHAWAIKRKFDPARLPA